MFIEKQEYRLQHLAFVFLLFVLKNKVTHSTMWPAQRYTELDMYLQGTTLASIKADTIFACYTKCENNILCSSINLMLTDKTCELKYSTKSRHSKIVNRTNTIYMEIRDAIGSTSRNPAPSCKWLRNFDIQVKSGVYWMKFNEPSSEPFQVFCDMTIDGGGWTLVYSYTFTKFNPFKTSENAVTPIPNWPLDKSSWTWVPESIITPLSEFSHSAMDFALWKKIGNEVFLKSNFTNSVACVEGTGSLVNWKAGSVTCKVVKAITPTCTTVTPTSFKAHDCGPFFYYGSQLSFYIFLDGMTNRCYPIHDPCGGDSTTNHLTSVSSPSGAIYIR